MGLGGPLSATGSIGLQGGPLGTGTDVVVIKHYPENLYCALLLPSVLSLTQTHVSWQNELPINSVWLNVCVIDS